MPRGRSWEWPSSPDPAAMRVGVIVLVRRESRVVRCFTADVVREETGRSVARSLSVHAELVTDPCEATETM